MKIKIDPGPFQNRWYWNLLLGVCPPAYYKLTDWVYSRRVNVKFQKGDMWDVGPDMCEVLLRVYQEFRKKARGIPYVPDTDLPEEMWVGTETDDSNEVFEKAYAEERINYVYGEIEWALSQVGDDNAYFDAEDPKAHQDRVNNGLRLVGQYLPSLWL